MDGTEATITRCGTCKKCGVAVRSLGSRGRTPSICVACKRQQAKERSRLRRINSCQKCSSEFEASSKQTKFCPSCRPTAEMMTCVVCGTVRKKSAAGGNSAGLCCSTTCAGVLRTRRAKERARLRGDGLRSLLSYVESLIEEERREASREYLAKCAAVADWMLEWDAPLRRQRIWRRSRPKGSRKHTVRAKRRGLPRSYSKAMSIERVGVRDGWICGLCSELIVDRESRSGPMSPCIDHIVPLNHKANTSHGHTPENVQIAHRKCNEAKGCSVACPSLFECQNPRKHIENMAINQLPPRVG